MYEDRQRKRTFLTSARCAFGESWRYGLKSFFLPATESRMQIDFGLWVGLPRQSVTRDFDPLTYCQGWHTFHVQKQVRGIALVRIWDSHIAATDALFGLTQIPMNAARCHQAVMQTRDLCFGQRNIDQREPAGTCEMRDFKMHS